MFTYGVFEKPTAFNEMNERCSVCDVRLQPEPGFYQGAMYVSYAISVGVLTAVGLTLWFLGIESEWTYIGAVVAVVILMVPFNYRVSRIIYLHAFGGIKYDPRLSP